MTKISVGRDEVYAWMPMAPSDGETVLEVDKETAARWNRINDEYYQMLSEIERAVREQQEAK